jgi:O-antigen/teichoic acid export membrane protein
MRQIALPKLGFNLPFPVLWRRAGANTLWFLLARVGSQLLMILFTGLVARQLGEAGLGQYAFITSLVFLGNTLATFGADTILIRELAAGRDWRLVLAGIALKLSISLIIIALVWWLAPQIPNQDPLALRALSIYVLALIPLSFYGVFSAVLRAYERMAAFMWLTLSVAVMHALGAFIALGPESDVLTLAFLLLIIQTIGTLLAAYLARSLVPGFRIDLTGFRPVVWNLLRLSWSLAVLSLATILYQRLSVIMLSLMGGEAATGWYAAAWRVSDAARILHYSLSGALLPILAFEKTGKSLSTQGSPAAAVLAASWKLLAGISIIAALALTMLAGPLISLLFGPGFEPSQAGLRIMTWSLVPFTLNASLSLAWIAAGEERPVLASLLVSLAALGLLNAILIPRWGFLGACWATLLAEFLQAGILLFLWRSSLFRWKNGSMEGNPTQQ